MADEAGKEPDSIRKRYLYSSGVVWKGWWGYHNEPARSYEESFTNILNGQKLKDLISQYPEPIVIDLMAPPGTTYDLLSDFPNGRGLAVSLPDHDIEDLREDIQEMYKSENVTWFPKDITHPQTWISINKWLNGQKANLILERGMVGLTWLPQKKLLYGTLVNKAWQNLDPNGGIFIFETPRRDELLKVGVDLDKWVEVLRQTIKDVRYDPGDISRTNPRTEGGKIMIVRTSDSPNLLPSI